MHVQDLQRIKGKRVIKKFVWISQPFYTKLFQFHFLQSFDFPLYNPKRPLGTERAIDIHYWVSVTYNNTCANANFLTMCL